MWDEGVGSIKVRDGEGRERGRGVEWLVSVRGVGGWKWNTQVGR